MKEGKKLVIWGGCPGGNKGLLLRLYKKILLVIRKDQSSRKKGVIPSPL